MTNVGFSCEPEKVRCCRNSASRNEALRETSKPVFKAIKIFATRSAFDLVAWANRGELRTQGVPSYGQLEQAYKTHQIDAETLVNRAIAAGELSPEAAQDEGYMNAVELHLRDLVDRGSDDS